MPKPANVVVTYKDSKGAEGQTIINIPNQDTLDLDEMIAMANWHALDMDNLSDAEIIRVSLIVDISPALFVSPGAEPGCDLEEGAEFIFAEAGGFTSQIRIPAFRQDAFLAGTPSVDLSFTEVQYFVDSMIDGYGTDTGMSPTLADVQTSRGEDLTVLLAAKKSFQKSRI